MTDDLFLALADRHRRRVLFALLERDPRDGPLRVLDDADWRSEERDEVAMYHNHLPRLRSDEFIRWDEETNEIRRGPRFEEIRPLLELLDEQFDDVHFERV